jgi:hypothetical protein
LAKVLDLDIEQLRGNAVCDSAVVILVKKSLGEGFSRSVESKAIVVASPTLRRRFSIVFLSEFNVLTRLDETVVTRSPGHHLPADPKICGYMTHKVPKVSGRFSPVPQVGEKLFRQEDEPGNLIAVCLGILSAGFGLALRQVVRDTGSANPEVNHLVH